MFQRELEYRAVSSIEDNNSIGIRILIKIIREDENPKLSKNKVCKLSDEEKFELHYFFPAYLIAEYWN